MNSNVATPEKSSQYIWILSMLERSKTLFALFLLCAVLTALTPDFLTASNITNVLRQTTLNAVLAVGAAFVILTGGIDLSVGSVLAFTSAITAGLLSSGVPLLVALLAGLLISASAGAIGGYFVAYRKVAPFIATLAMMTIFRGLTLVYTDGRPITGLGDSFSFIGAGYVGPIPFPIIITIIIYIIAYYVLKHTRFGRYIYAVGGNEEASRLSGIGVNPVKLAVYAISAMMAFISGIIITARLDSAQPIAGTGAELDAIAACVIGGISLSGGRGSIYGVLVGALIIGVLNNGLNLLDVSPFYQQIVKGAVIMIAVLLDRGGRKSA